MYSASASWPMEGRRDTVSDRDWVVWRSRLALGKGLQWSSGHLPDLLHGVNQESAFVLALLKSLPSLFLEPLFKRLDHSSEVFFQSVRTEVELSERAKRFNS